MTILALISFYVLIPLGLVLFAVLMWKRRGIVALMVLAAMAFIGGYTLNGLGLESWQQYDMTGVEGAWGNFYQIAYDLPFYLGFALLAVAGAITLFGWWRSRDERIKDRAAIPGVDAISGEAKERQPW